MGTNAATVAVFANNVGSFHTHVHIRRHLNAFGVHVHLICMYVLCMHAYMSVIRQLLLLHFAQQLLHAYLV